MTLMTHDFIEKLTRQTNHEHGSAPLHGEQIVFLSHQRWNTHVTAVQNTAVRLARHNQVLFMEPPDSIGWLLHEPPARAAISTFLAISAKYGFAMSGISRPMLRVRFRRSPRASGSGEKCSLFAAFRTASSVLRLMPYSRALPFSARETVVTETPNCSAMAFSVGLEPCFILMIPNLMHRPHRSDSTTRAAAASSTPAGIHYGYHISSAFTRS